MVPGGTTLEEALVRGGGLEGDNVPWRGSTVLGGGYSPGWGMVLGRGNGPGGGGGTTNHP